MKMIHYSLVATYVSVFAAVVAPRLLKASDARSLNPISSAMASDDTLLAQAAAASSDQPAGKAPKVNVDQNGVILKGYDAVAYIKQKRAVKGDPKFSSKYGGATYYFASAKDKAIFDKSPAKYVPQYGAYCANGMTKKEVNDIDPNVFFVYHGKLYLCQTKQAGEHFYSDPDANIKKADANWELYQLPHNPGFRREFGS
ncbi:MAG: YHS domain-containing protein [Verrucomicrobia bacterium]|nr:YHS domain-containing protein [Verrucomicrobiota bacterium]